MRPSVPQPGLWQKSKTRAWEEFGETMEKDYWLASKRFLANRPAPQEGEAVFRQHCLQCGWGAADLVWGHYRAVEGVLRGSPQSCRHAFPGGSRGWGSFITQAEVPEVV
ncbi:hypothetical protein ILYODFUR_012680 [Ilyodon furcidens]|uniref:Uncharacterized protein n=1 Tax=Ilyodon furcidens TaxID=33524 RepID=A0ABV0VDG2_9TELE